LTTPEETATVEPAWEIKFLLPAKTAAAVEEWARWEMGPDPHGDPARGGAYEVTTLYPDTPGFDVFHRVKEFERRKVRVRSYGAGGPAFLERKSRRKDRVSKRRTAVPASEVPRLGSPPSPGPWAGEWFHDEVADRGFRPVCAVSYLRTAFLGAADEGPFRLTLDRGIRCAPASGWSVPSVDGKGIPVGIPGGEVVCELKFRDAMPQPFKLLVARLALAPSGLSKYRRACRALGLVEEGADA
jgi:hypothetical protein